ncbi:hypothetical protein AAFX91_32230, partial [Bradyrhizobium sp. 31Argb]|uniref:hypothetical protein n=1 Tax=Bradyrhizobium sp. 31Argb TaxID=3141247 RepID=UPI0037483F74
MAGIGRSLSFTSQAPNSWYFRLSWGGPQSTFWYRMRQTEASSKRFRAKWTPVRVKKTRQNKTLGRVDSWDSQIRLNVIQGFLLGGSL